MDYSYIAGFFDGEGTLHRFSKVKNKFSISISQTNKEVLLQIKDFCGFGQVYNLKKRKENWKDAWVYRITKISDILIFIENMEKYLVVKKELINKNIPIIQKMLFERKIKSKITSTKIKKLKKYLKKGMSYRQIEKKYNITRSFISWHKNNGGLA